MDGSSGVNLASGASVSITIGADIKSAEESINKLISKVDTLKRKTGELEVKYSENTQLNKNISSEKKLNTVRSAADDLERVGLKLNKEQLDMLMQTKLNDSKASLFNAQTKYRIAKDPVASAGDRDLRRYNAETRAKRVEVKGEELKVKQQDVNTKAERAKLEAEKLEFNKQKEIARAREKEEQLELSKQKEIARAKEKEEQLNLKKQREDRIREQIEYRKNKPQISKESLGLSDYLSMLSDMSTLSGMDTSGIAKLLKQFLAMRRISSNMEKLRNGRGDIPSNSNVNDGVGSVGEGSKSEELASGVSGLIGKLDAAKQAGQGAGSAGDIAALIGSGASKLKLLIAVVYRAFKFMYGQGKIGYETQVKINNALKTVDKASLETANSLERLKNSSMSVIDSLEFIGKASKMFISQGISTERGTQIGNDVLTMAQDIAGSYNFTEKPESIAEKISSDIQTGGNSAAEYGIRVSDNYIKSWALATKGIDLYHTKVSEAYMVQLRFEKALKDASVYAGSYEKNIGSVSGGVYQSASMLSDAWENLRHELEPVYSLMRNIGSVFTGFAAKALNTIASGVDFLNDMYMVQLDVEDGFKGLEDETDELLTKQENLNAAYAAWSDYLDKIQKELFGFEDLTVMSNIQTDNVEMPEGVDAEFSVELDETTTKQDVEKAVGVINKQLGKIDKVEIKADINEATGKVRGFTATITDIEGKTVTISANLKHEMEVEEFERLINSKLPDDKQIKIDAETGVAMDNLGGVANLMDGLISKTGSYESAVESLQSLLGEFTDVTSDLRIVTSGLTLESLLNIKNTLDGLSDKQVTVDFIVNEKLNQGMGGYGSGTGAGVAANDKPWYTQLLSDEQKLAIDDFIGKIMTFGQYDAYDVKNRQIERSQAEIDRIKEEVIKDLESKKVNNTTVYVQGNLLANKSTERGKYIAEETFMRGMNRMTR